MSCFRYVIKKVLNSILPVLNGMEDKTLTVSFVKYILQPCIFFYFSLEYLIPNISGKYHIILTLIYRI